MPTGLIIAVNASQLLAQEEAASTAVALRPAHFAHAASFGAPKLISFAPEVGVTLKPANFTHASSFGAPMIVHQPPQLLRPAHFLHSSIFGAPRVIAAGSGFHLDWRLLISDNNGDGSFVSVGHIDMFDGYGRVNQCVGGTPIASSGGVFGNVTANSFADAFDTGQWAVAKTGADWIGYTFPAPVAVNGLTLRTFAAQNALMLKDFDVQFSDDSGASWATAWSVANATYAGQGDYFPLTFWNPSYDPGSYSESPATPRRYWRHYGLTRAGPSSYACAEMELRLSPSGSQAATGGTPIAKASAGGAAANAFDADAGTYWANNSGGGDNAPSWLGYDLGAGNEKAIAEVTWQARNDNPTAATQSPTRGVIQASSDNTNWSSIFETFDATTWTVGMQKAFADPLYI